MFSGKTIAALTAALLVESIAPADAGTISKTVLDTNKWKNNAVAQAGEIACNYLYTDANDRLLYYGTSQNCRTRISQHANEIRHVLNLLHAIDDFSPAPMRAPLWNWSATVHTDGNGNELGPYEERGTSDMCLATNENFAGGTAAKPKIAVWYFPLPNRVTAKAVEDCVLETTVGYCNRKGQGTVQGSGAGFIKTVNDCVVKKQSESKH